METLLLSVVAMIALWAAIATGPDSMLSALSRLLVYVIGTLLARINRRREVTLEDQVEVIQNELHRFCK